MAKKTDVDFDYTQRRRYIVEIKDEQTGKLIFGQGVGSLKHAIRVRNGYSEHKDLKAQIHDKKTGKILEGDFITSG